MNGLRTARVLVIDDEFEEAMPVLRVLGTKGIGAIYVSGDRFEELPDEPFGGIRLAFVDMDLGSGGGDIKATTTATMTVLQRVIEPTGGPIVLVTWTKHGEYVDEFRRLFRDQFPNKIALIVDGIVKPGPDEIGQAEYRATLFGEIEERIKSLAPANIMWEWEQAIHNATSTTTGAFASLAAEKEGANDPDNTEEEVIQKFANGTRDVLAVLAYGVRGRAVGDHSHVLHGVLDGLIPVLADNTTGSDVGKAFSDDACEIIKSRVQEKIENPKTLELLVSDNYARLNRVLLLSPPTPVSDEIKYMPGDIYLEDDWPDAEVSLDGLSKEQFLRSLKLVDGGAEKEEQEAGIKATKWALIEITPVCDHAQSKATNCRLLRGVLLPEIAGIRQKVGSHIGYVVHFAPMLVSDEDRASGFRIKDERPIKLVFDLRYVIGASPEELAKYEAACRLRAEPLQTVVASFGAHASRAPHLSVSHT